MHQPLSLVGLAQNNVLTALRGCAAGNADALVAVAEEAILTATLNPNEATEERKLLLAQRFQLRLGQLVRVLEGHRDDILSERDGMALMNGLFFAFIEDEFGAGTDQVKVRLAPVMRRLWAEFERTPNARTLSALTDDWNPARMSTTSSVLSALMGLVWLNEVMALLPAGQAREPAESPCARKTEEPVLQAAVKADIAVLPVVPVVDPGRPDQALKGRRGNGPRLPVGPRVPSLSSSVINAISAAFWSPKRTTRVLNDKVVITRPDAAIVGRVKSDYLSPENVTALRNILHSTERLAAHRLLRWVVARVNHQYEADPNGAFRNVLVHGGLSGLAEELGIKSSKASNELRDALNVFSHVEVELPRGDFSALLDWTAERGVRGSPGRLTITVADALLPTYVFSLTTKSQSQREARQLVPVPPMPPLAGAQVSHGPQAALQMLVVQEIRRHAAGVAEGAPVEVQDETWYRMARQVGIPMKDVPDIIEVWVKGNSKSEPFLVRPIPEDECRYVLAGTAAHEAIVKAGEKSKRGRKAERMSRKARFRR